MLQNQKPTSSILSRTKNNNAASQLVTPAKLNPANGSSIGSAPLALGGSLPISAPLGNILPLVDSNEIVHEDGNKAENSGETTVLAFMILQCKGCKTIIGDTFSMLSLNRASLIMTLQKKNDNVIVDSDLETSREEGDDYGCTFNNLHCKNCNEWLGRFYRTTTPEIDHLRGNYTFSLGQLIMYEMNHLAQESLANPVFEPQTRSENTVISAPQSNNNDSIEIVKCQKFILHLHDLVGKLQTEIYELREASALQANELAELRGSTSINSSVEEEEDEEERESAESSSQVTPKKQSKPRKPRQKKSQTDILKQTALQLIGEDVSSLDPTSRQSVESAITEEEAVEIVSESILRHPQTDLFLQQLRESSITIS